MNAREWNAVIAIVASAALAVLGYEIFGLWGDGWGEALLFLITVGWFNFCLNLGTSIGRWAMGKPIQEATDQNA